MKKKNNHTSATSGVGGRSGSTIIDKYSLYSINTTTTTTHPLPTDVPTLRCEEKNDVLSSSSMSSSTTVSDTGNMSPTSAGSRTPLSGAEIISSPPDTVDSARCPVLPNRHYPYQRRAKAQCVSLDFAPEYLRLNRFILTGYRIDHSYKDCFSSIISAHNETGNIWTHLLGFLFFVVLLSYWCTTIFLTTEYNIGHQIVWSLFFIGCFTCLGCSTFYHTVNCHSASTNLWARGMDYFGVTLLILGSMYPLVYYILACHPIARWLYIGTISTLGLAGLIGPIIPSFFSPRWTLPRTALYAGLAMSGIAPLIHAHCVLPFEGENKTNFALVYGMYLSYGVGLFFFVSQIPERFFPGKFDLWLQSHQLWHIFVLGGAYIHFQNCLRIHQQWASKTALGFQCS